ncbi:hypothetical protein [Streptomyces sp. NBC_00151]|uniref:hypothetical protein n=1 Tax=Streptomyces sp. NBC_00151 TaxID=2975669 RepID=UPI002DDAC6E2|nr:hypothetical protein [Streptomyces sp. NBC_00151]WRZ40914.1 hypothetical protein OG915_24485 [Streptomyces sp. NBC_00151]
MFRHAEQPEPGRWDLEWIQRMVNACRESCVDSLVDLDLSALGGFSSSIDQGDAAGAAVDLLHS